MPAVLLISNFSLILNVLEIVIINTLDGICWKCVTLLTDNMKNKFFKIV